MLSGNLVVMLSYNLKFGGDAPFSLLIFWPEVLKFGGD